MSGTKEIIDFAEWYSGMDRTKVERAYSRYLKEVVKKDAVCDFCGSPAIKGKTYCEKCAAYRPM